MPLSSTPLILATLLAGRERLRGLLGRLMARIALPRDEVERIRPNLNEVARAHPEVDAGLLAKDSPWRELIPVAKEGVDLESLPFAILHGPRRALPAADRRGGLEAIGPDEPVPQMVGCFPRPQGGPLVPAKASCTLCHGLEGRGLMTPSFHSIGRVDVLRPDNTIAQDAVVRARKETGYGSLRGFFARD